VATEHQLLRKARKLDPEALAEIYDLYSEGLFRYAYRQLGDTHLAEDCVADTFKRLLQAFSKGGGPKHHLQAYLYRIAHNWITDTYRSKHEQTAPLDEQVEARPDTDAAVEEQAMHAISIAHVRAALHHLTDDQRQAITLKFLEGWSNAEIAETMEKPVGAVKALTHRGVAALQRILVTEKETLYETTT
jgi:RNA polymerase sigma-70 factor (ECF subfamily)